MKLLHKYNGRELAILLDIYDREILDDEGEPHSLRKTDGVLFERITGILPIQIKLLTKENLVRTLEVLVKHDLGSERMFRDYLVLKIERNMNGFSAQQYSRLVRALADKMYVEDIVLWNEYIF